MSDDNDYPLEKEIQAKGSNVELSFDLYTHFGSHDSSTTGSSLSEIVLNNGEVVPVAYTPDEWKEIAPGIEIKDTLTYSSSGRDSSRLIRIQPSACPLTLRLRRVYEYSTSDFPHEEEHSSKNYSIRVVDQ